MQQEFYELADHLTGLLRDGEIHNCSYSGEVSDFVRFNKSSIRQPGRVAQRSILVDLIRGNRHAAGMVSLAGRSDIDRERVESLVRRLRENLAAVPEDPYLLYATEVRNSERIQENRLPAPQDAVDAILRAGKGKDLVGIYAAGGIHAGFANSLGQRNWYASYSFNHDWSFYHSGDKAVKCAYAGFQWDPAAFDAKVAAATQQLEVLTKPARTIPPGRYRVYLTPSAMNELLGTVSWGGFGLKEQKTRNTSLLRMIEGKAKLHESVSIFENTSEGVAPDFQGQGFIKPERVTLVDRGAYRDSLVSPRSAKEYGLPTNGASSSETPESIEVSAGTIPTSEILQRLGTGVYISNLWYLNYSDRPACRITGMTRFATLWVEDGQIVAPLQVMRFDETFYRMLGENLIGLTAEREMILDAGSYEARSTGSGRMPGALIQDFTFTL